jgi:hypothetical protein
MPQNPSRRSFLQTTGLGAAVWGLTSATRGAAQQKQIQGFEEESGRNIPARSGNR